MANRRPVRARFCVLRGGTPAFASADEHIQPSLRASVSARLARFASRIGDRGQSLVEFALVVPVLLLLLVIAVDFGRLFFSYIEVNNAAREGTAFAAANPTDTSGIQARALQEASVQSQRGEGALTITASCQNTAGTAIACADAPGGNGTGNTITVKASEPFTFLTPLVGGLLGSPFPVSASASSSVLGLVASAGGSTSVCASLPTASFTVTNVGIYGVTMNANASTPTTGACAISGYNWDMGDAADPFPPIVNNPASYTYLTAGTYVITLEVTNSAGSATTTQSVTVGPTPTPTPTPAATPTPAPTAPPTAPPTPSPTPTCNFVPTFTYEFTGNGNGTKADQMTFHGAYTGQPAPVTWTWAFGESGETGSGQTASNNYNSAHAAPGVTVTLTIKNGTCQASVSHSVVVP